MCSNAQESEGFKCVRARETYAMINDEHLKYKRQKKTSVTWLRENYAIFFLDLSMLMKSSSLMRKLIPINVQLDDHQQTEVLRDKIIYVTDAI